MAFKRSTPESPAPPTPRELYGQLPRSTESVPNLWAHQGSVLDAYASEHLETPDLALELPTGTGKTLIGLLIVEWRRRRHGERAVYACPTRQLADQVARAARDERIDVVQLSGRSSLWSAADVSSYNAADVLAVTTYNTIFNLRPKLSAPGVLLFDDAHAAEGYVADSWSATIERGRHQDLYLELLTALEPCLDGLLVAQLRFDDPDPTFRRQVTLAPVLSGSRVRAAVASVLAGWQEGDIGFRLAMIREGLAACLIYLSWDQIYIRPYVPPTFQHAHFSTANQRLYLSATMGSGGELERAFGRAEIARMEAPTGFRVGRRFFVFADLAQDAVPEDLTQGLLQEARRGLVLVPSDSKAESVKASLIPPGMSVLGKDALESEASLAAFAATDGVALVLANRYDGIDLPGEKCRAIVLAGLPSATHLQERFLATRAKADVVLQERMRTRVVQGTGRCTRGPLDFALVVVVGSDLTQFLSTSDVRSTMRPELQAELRFGFRNSVADLDEIYQNVRAFLDQSQSWEDDAEPELSRLRSEVEEAPIAAASALSAAVKHEVRACEAAWGAQWLEASRSAQRAANELGGKDTRAYRAFWLYLGAAWLFLAGEESKDERETRAAEELLRQAADTARPTTWLKDSIPRDSAQPVEPDESDEAAIAAIATKIEKGVNRRKQRERVESMLDGLEGTASGPYENGLETLGTLLGAESKRPSGQGKGDGAWRFARFWIAIEAKSDEKAEGQIPINDIRQATGHLKTMADDIGESPPDDSITVLATPRSTIASEAIAHADAHLHVVPLLSFAALAGDISSVWERVLDTAHGVDGTDLRELIRREMAMKKVLPSDVRDRLTERPVNPRS